VLVLDEEGEKLRQEFLALGKELADLTKRRKFIDGRIEEIVRKKAAIAVALRAALEDSLRWLS
jgi:hypothetical protein